MMRMRSRATTGEDGRRSIDKAEVDRNATYSALVQFFRVGFLPGPHVLSGFVEQANVIVLGDLLGEGRAEFFPKRLPGVVALPYDVPVAGSTLIAAVEEAVGIFAD